MLGEGVRTVGASGVLCAGRARVSGKEKAGADREAFEDVEEEEEEEEEQEEEQGRGFRLAVAGGVYGDLCRGGMVGRKAGGETRAGRIVQEACTALLKGMWLWRNATGRYGGTAERCIASAAGSFARCVISGCAHVAAVGGLARGGACGQAAGDGGGGSHGSNGCGGARRGGVAQSACSLRLRSLASHWACARVRRGEPVHVCASVCTCATWQRGDARRAVQSLT